MDLLMEGKLDEEQTRVHRARARGWKRPASHCERHSRLFEGRSGAARTGVDSIRYLCARESDREAASAWRDQKGDRTHCRLCGRCISLVYGRSDSGWSDSPVNPLSNAIKFTEKGSVQLRVSRRLEMLRSDVTDSGLGIDEHAIKRLFQPFRQADESTTRKYGGTGLGLAIAKALTHRMNGEIGAQSESGKGSTFWFCVRLPACTEVDDAPEPVSLRDVVKIQIQPTEMHARPILVAEDNPVNRRLMCGFLQQLSFRVVEVETGDAAIEEYKKGTAFAAILMDWQMPGCDGITADERIGTIEKMDRREHVPIIGLSANALAGDREQCMGAGMDERSDQTYSLRRAEDGAEAMGQGLGTPRSGNVPRPESASRGFGNGRRRFSWSCKRGDRDSSRQLNFEHRSHEPVCGRERNARTSKTSAHLEGKFEQHLPRTLLHAFLRHLDEKMARRGDGLGASRLFGQLRKEYEQVRIDCQRYLRGELLPRKLNLRIARGGWRGGCRAAPSLLSHVLCHRLKSGATGLIPSWGSLLVDGNKDNECFHARPRTARFRIFPFDNHFDLH